MSRSNVRVEPTDLPNLSNSPRPACAGIAAGRLCLPINADDFPARMGQQTSTTRARSEIPSHPALRQTHSAKNIPALSNDCGVRIVMVKPALSRLRVARHHRTVTVWSAYHLASGRIGRGDGRMTPRCQINLRAAQRPRCSISVLGHRGQQQGTIRGTERRRGHGFDIMIERSHEPQRSSQQPETDQEA